MARNCLFIAMGVFVIVTAAPYPADAKSCGYFLGYIKSETERPYALKKVYRYTPERLQAIHQLRDKGGKLCRAGKDHEGVKVLVEAVKLINFTRLR